MMLTLRQDLIKFTLAFILPLIAFILIGMLNSSEFTVDSLNVIDIGLNLFSAFTGEQDFGAFTVYSGQIYLVLFIMAFFLLLLNLLIAMFTNTF